MKTIYLFIICLCLIITLQAQVSKTVNVTTPGSLKNALTSDELASITNLTITGTIDARDFKTMRDDIQYLVDIDLSKVTIAEYIGTEGTWNSEDVYLKDQIPSHAFDGTVHISEPADTDTARFKSIVLPSSIKTICDRAFSGCSSMTSINIPSSVDNINSGAFNNCTGLISIYCNGSIPPSFLLPGATTFGYVQPFRNVDKGLCVLYVPIGRKELYASAERWQDFKNIVEIPTGVYDIEKDIAQFNSYPNPFTNQLSIEIQNPKHIKLTVNIYNIGGQRIKNLAMGNTSEQLNLSWDGTNEKGQKVLHGVYICKMNRQTMQIVKGR